MERSIVLALAEMSNLDRSQVPLPTLSPPAALTQQLADVCARYEWLSRYLQRMAPGLRRDLLTTVHASATSNLFKAAGSWQLFRQRRGLEGWGSFTPAIGLNEVAAIQPPGIEGFEALASSASAAHRQHGEKMKKQSLRSVLMTFWTGFTVAERNLAQPAFLLPSQLGTELMGTQLTTTADLPDLHLPFATTNVWFETAMDIPQEAFAAGDALDKAMDVRLQALEAQLGQGRSYGEVSANELFLAQLDALEYKAIHGFTLHRQADGGVSPVVTLSITSKVGRSLGVAEREVHTAVDIDLSHGSALAPALLNVAAALSFEYWKRPGAAIDGGEEPVALTPSPTDENAQQDPAELAFYVLDTDTASPGPSIASGVRMPEYTQPEHWKPVRVGSRTNWPGTYVVRRIGQHQVNADKGRPVSKPTSFRIPTSDESGWHGFFDGDVVVRDENLWRKVGHMGPSKGPSDLTGSAGP